MLLIEKIYDNNTSTMTEFIHRNRRQIGPLADQGAYSGEGEPNFSFFSSIFLFLIWGGGSLKMLKEGKIYKNVT